MHLERVAFQECERAGDGTTVGTMSQAQINGWEFQNALSCLDGAMGCVINHLEKASHLSHSAHLHFFCFLAHWNTGFEAITKHTGLVYRENKLNLAVNLSEWKYL